MLRVGWVLVDTWIFGRAGDFGYVLPMNPTSRFRVAAVLFGIAGAASALCAIMLLVRDGVGWLPTLFVAASGCYSLAAALSQRKHRQLA